MVQALDPEEIDREMKSMKRSIMTLKVRFTEIAKRDTEKYK
jgi:hypothetical protein